MDASILEAQVRAGNEARRLRNQYLVSFRRAHDARGFVDGEAANLAADELDLTDVYGRSHEESLGAGHTLDRSGTVQCRRWSREPCKKPVAGRIDLHTRMPLELDAGCFVVFRQELAPGREPHPRSRRRRIDDVRQEQRDERPAVDPGGKSRQTL